jgi:DNA repair protein SbcD/Mre11
VIRLLHTSDWHLGRLLYGQSLIEDQSYILDRLLELIDERKPHALLIAGDVFDRALPPEPAVTLFDHFLDQTAGKRNLPVFLIPGNHDSCERLGFASTLLRDRGVTIFARVQDALNPVRLKGEAGAEVLIHGIPFLEPIEIGQHLQREDLRTPDEAIGALCRHMLEQKTCQTPSVLLCHAFVVGGEISESEKEIYIGGSSQVNARAFEGFSYTALGHLHKPQRAGHDHVRYSGSLLPYSKSEVGHSKSITEICLHADGAVEIHETPLRQKRQLRYLEGPLDQLIDGAKDDSAREDYVIAGFTDSGAVLDSFARLRTVYPNLLHVSRAGGFVPETLPSLALRKELDQVSELELFTEFFKATTGADLTDEERTALIETIKNLSAEERS